MDLKNTQNWFELKGDETLALDWPLDEKSTVWEIGGYEGRWTQQIWDKFHCFIDVFEPQDWAFERLMKRFGNNPKIFVHNFGLWVENTQRSIVEYETDGASIVKGNGEHKADFQDICEVGFKVPIDVCLMNIEGAEFVLLPYMIGNGMMKNIKFFWCQFHLFYSFSADRMEGIARMLDATHEIMWNCYPTAVAWKRRE